MHTGTDGEILRSYTIYYIRENQGVDRGMIPDQLREQMKGIRINASEDEDGILERSEDHMGRDGCYNGVKWSAFYYIPITYPFTHYELSHNGETIIKMKYKGQAIPTFEEMETLIEEHTIIKKGD